MEEDSHGTFKIIPWCLEDFRIRLISWNIAGLDEDYLEERTEAICTTLLQENPHVVLLQEVIEESEEIIRDKLSTAYEYVSAKVTSSYYSAVLARKDVVHVEETNILPFPTTKMGRNLLVIRCTIKGERFCIMTSHLESMKQSSEERMAQLKMAFTVMQKEEPSRTAVFGGDLNLRHYEIDQAGGLPDGIYDIWELTGRRPEAEFTWDCQINDNLDFVDKIKDPRRRPKIRFDRLYIRYSSAQSVKVEHFELMGFKRLPECEDCFCSDHWGLMTHFNIIAKMPK